MVDDINGEYEEELLGFILLFITFFVPRVCSNNEKKNLQYRYRPRRCYFHVQYRLPSIASSMAIYMAAWNLNLDRE
jgi:hypothetical protein